jgi:GAF domain-containing protein
VTDPVLRAALEAAASATGAGRGWILAAPGSDGSMEVLAATGGTAGGIGATVPVDGSVAGYVASLGQPLASVPRSADQFPNDVALLGGGAGPGSILCVPCEHDDNSTGVLQLVDAAAGSFSFDDVELVTLLAGVVAAALAERANGDANIVVPQPPELSASLERLAEVDPGGYRSLATLLAALLSDV